MEADKSAPNATDSGDQSKVESEEANELLICSIEFNLDDLQNCTDGPCSSCPCSRGEYGYGCELGEW